ncbi:MAG TPA: GAF domain-containing protein, partial [Anaeromyxobacteraceae bacterium]|nr:GAF domain-containing protein [Anaeromyxobacteraceae bacterium]
PPAAAPAKPAAPPAPPRQPVRRAPQEAHREDLLADLFLRAPQVRARAGRDEGLGFLLDLALEKVRCEAGSALLASGDGLLSFAVARGPKAAELLRLAPRIPMGVGIVGFCAQESVALAVSDAEGDARHHRAVSEAVKHPARSLVCAPIARGGRVFGALELVNKVGGGFDEADLAVLSYLAHQAAEFLAARDAAE